jgi:hypothetical protein
MTHNGIKPFVLQMVTDAFDGDKSRGNGGIALSSAHTSYNSTFLQ